MTNEKIKNARKGFSDADIIQKIMTTDMECPDFNKIVEEHMKDIQYSMDDVKYMEAAINSMSDEIADMEKTINKLMEALKRISDTNCTTCSEIASSAIKEVSQNEADI